MEFKDDSEYGSEYIPSKGIIKNSKISGKNAALWLEKNCEVTVENTELIGLQYAALYVIENPKLTMSDVYLHNEGSVNDYQVISGYVDNDNVVDYFNQFVKEGYIYWKDPEYKNGDTYSSSNKGMQNHNLWIIKQQQEYENEDNTYVIPEDNEIIIKVSGYKVLLEDIMINGEVVPNTNYEILDSDDNEVIIKLSSDYLKTLEANEYDVEVVFVNGSSKSKLTIQDAEVKNEEETPVIVVNPKTALKSYTYLLVIAIIAGITAIIIGKKSYFKSK